MPLDSESLIHVGQNLRCSVVIPTFNRRLLLRQSLLSLARQDIGRDSFEVLVVDDGSSDGTEDEVRAFDGELNIRYFYQPDEGYRVARARNVGIRNAEAPVCVFVDSGVVLRSDALGVHVARHQSAPGPVAIVGYVYGFNENNEDAAEIESEIRLDAIDSTIDDFEARGRFLDFREIFYARHGDEIGDLAAPWVVFWTCHVSAPTASLKAAGLFDEAFQCWGGEDVELAYRLHLEGVRFELSREARSIHLPHPKNAAVNSELAARNYPYFAAKHPGVGSLIVDYHLFDINDAIHRRDIEAREVAPDREPLQISGSGAWFAFDGRD
jgi:glycosyltransferase involved in cell wall biosynthesis